MSALLGLAAAPSSDGGLTLSVKPHAFEGAVLSPKHARELTPSLCLAIASALSEQAYRRNVIPYTLWITEAWRVLGWAEPSAALFWEMATMYHTLYLAGRAYAADYHESQSHIPPILSCGSASSLGSGNTPTTFPNHPDKKKYSTAASAKELPVWLVGTFLLLHCEESAYLRNLSGQDERRFFSGAGSGVGGAAEPVLKNTSPGGKVDFTSLLKHPALSPRTRIHAGWNHDNTHCIAYSLRHLRKLLLLSAVSHNPEAVRACMHLAAIPAPALSLSATRRAAPQHSTDDLRRQHDEEHGNVGSDVRLTMDDLERLHFWMQPPSGGGVDDPPLKIGEFLWTSLYATQAPPTASIALAEVEREIRRHLELELLMAGHDQDETSDASQASSHNEDDAAAAMSNLSISDSRQSSNTDEVSRDTKMQTTRARQPQQGYQKELSYTHLRGTTILLKPNAHYSENGPSSGASASSGDNFAGLAGSSGGRLHDLAIYDCSDAHMYLLQPFEHVTIAACTGCTIVVGAVAGLLHIVDCEKTTVTSAARRMLVSNSFDVLHCVFTPSPPLLVGDNRNCQFAPYNTYYDGLREDLLATGLAAAVVPENQSPYHGNRNQENDAAWPPLQCASNKWKQPVELAKLEIPQVQTSGSGSGSGSPASAGGGGGAASPGADDKAVSGSKSGTGNDDTMHTPVLLPASEFHVLLVPLESDSARQKRLDAEEQLRLSPSGESSGSVICPLESQYCRNLAEIMQLCPFRLPVEYERRALEKADRMKSLQQTIQKNLTEEQKLRLEEELNRGFRDWLVTSGNLRQVLDLVHMERRGGA